MLLNHLLLLPTVSSAVHVSTDLAKTRAKEQVDLVRININGHVSCPFVDFFFVLVMKVDDKPIYLIILTLSI